MTAEEVFFNFRDSATENASQPKKIAMAIPVRREEETKQASMYAEVDSDNESDFDVKYEQVEDNYEDLKTIQKPVFISDLLLGLQSDDVKRFTLAIQSAEDLLRG